MTGAILQVLVGGAALAVLFALLITVTVHSIALRQRQIKCTVTVIPELEAARDIRAALRSRVQRGVADPNEIDLTSELRLVF
jgi:hypothetical protein